MRRIIPAVALVLMTWTAQAQPIPGNQGTGSGGLAAGTVDNCVKYITETQGGDSGAPCGGGSPGGANGDLQTNNAGAFGGLTPGSGVATWLATPSSANLAAAVTGETGSGALVFGTSPTLVTPALGTPSSLDLSNATGVPASAGPLFNYAMPSTADFIRSDGSNLLAGTFGTGLALSAGTVNLTQSLQDRSGSGTAIVTGDASKTVLLGAFTYTLAQAGTSGFETGWGACLLNTGASAATVNATTSIFKGASEATSLVIPAKGWACPSSNGTDYQTVVGNYGAALLAAEGQVLAGGATVTAKSKTAGNLTVNCGERPLQYQTNSGAFTLTAPAADGSCMLLSTNDGSAGTITFSGFTVGSSTGDALTTTNTHKFTISIWRINGVSGYRVAAHQ